MVTVLEGTCTRKEKPAGWLAGEWGDSEKGKDCAPWGTRGKKEVLGLDVQRVGGLDGMTGGGGGGGIAQCRWEIEQSYIRM